MVCNFALRYVSFADAQLVCNVFKRIKLSAHSAVIEYMAATTTGRENKMYAATLILCHAIPAILILSTLRIPTHLIAAALNQ
jgi:hypothetical protein